MNFFIRVRNLIKNIIHLNSIAYETYKAKERINDQAKYTRELERSLQELQKLLQSQQTMLQRYELQLQQQTEETKKQMQRQNEETKKQLEPIRQDHEKFRKQHAIYEQTHNNTERTMYHLVQKHLLAQSIMFQEQLQQLLENPSAKPLASLSKPYLDTYYLAFENKFRGSRESILSRYEAYYGFVETKPLKALDIGCGRAEWVEILHSKNIDAYGIDLNGAMLEVGKAHGIQNLYEAEAIEFLRNTPSHTYDLITAFHIIEHIQFQDLLVLLSQIKRVAKPNATILLETPNPANLQVAATHFYNDPTHLNPLPSRVIEFMLEYLGFYEVKTHPINPYAQEHHLKSQTEEAGTLNRFLFSAQDYVITAKA